MVAKEPAEETPTDTTFFPYEGDESSQDESSQALVNTGEPDVLLEAPEVNVERISIETERVRTGVSLFARIGNFVALEVGANAQLDNVSLKMRGVRAQGKVRVHLQKVYAIILRTLASIDRKPELAGREKPVPELGATAGTDMGEPPQGVEKAAAPGAEKGGTAVEQIKGAISTSSKATAEKVKKAVPSVETAADKVKATAVPSVETAADKVKATVPSAEMAADKVKKVVPSAARAAGEVAKKADQATSKIKEAAAGDERHDKTDRVLRPIKHAAHEVADKVRLAITMAKVAATTHKATRAPRRAAKASGHVAKSVLHPDVPGLKRK